MANDDYWTCFSDIFADEGSEKPKKAKTPKKKTKKATKDIKDLSEFDNDAPSIFDDPLSALGGKS